MMNNDDLDYRWNNLKVAFIIYVRKHYLTPQRCPFFSKIPRLNSKATMMGYIHKSLYHKYEYN